MATSTLPSRVPMAGRNQNGYLTPAFLRSPWRGETKMATPPLLSRGVHGGEKPKWLHHPCLLGVPMAGRNPNGYITPAFSGCPWQGDINLEKSGCGGDQQKKCERGGMGEAG